jgi:LysR family glycine cleavage system transcriptional activator
MSDPLAAIPLSAIRVFEAAARLRSFTRAAAELNITQAAVSWQVKALEQRLGQSLFSRLPREVVLTASGERLARAASQAVTLLRTAVTDITETGDGVLAITTLQSLANQWLAPRLGAFQLAHPKIAVRLETTGRIVDLTREDADVALRAGPGDWPGMTSHWLFASEGTVLCTPELMRKYAVTEPADLLRAPRVGSDREWNDWFAAAGVEVPPGEHTGPRLVADLQTIEIASALAGQGAALASPVFFAPEIAAGRLVRPFRPTISFSAGYWLTYPTDRRRSPKIVAFRDWVLKTVAEDPVTAPR